MAYVVQRKNRRAPRFIGVLPRPRRPHPVSRHLHLPTRPPSEPPTARNSGSWPATGTTTPLVRSPSGSTSSATGCPPSTSRPTTRAAYVSNLDKHFLPFFGTKLMYQITPSLVQDWVTKAAAEGLSARSIRKYHTMLHSIFKRAVRDQLIVTNPCEHTELPKVMTKKTRTLTPEEFDVLIAAFPDRYRLMVETAIETGHALGRAHRAQAPAHRLPAPHDHRRGHDRRGVQEALPDRRTVSSPSPTPRTTSPGPSPSARTGSTPSPSTSNSATSAATTCCSPPQPAHRSPATPSAPASGCLPSRRAASPSTSACTTSGTPTPPGSWPAAPISSRSWTGSGHAQIQTTQKYLHALTEADQRNLDALDRMTRRKPL